MAARQPWNGEERRFLAKVISGFGRRERRDANLNKWYHVLPRGGFGEDQEATCDLAQRSVKLTPPQERAEAKQEAFASALS